MSKRLVVSAVVVAALTTLWAAAAYVLWQSSVPSLNLPHLEPRAFFSAHDLHEARSYSSGARLLWLGATVAQLAGLAVFVRYGARWARESAAGRMGTGMLLGMLGFALVWAVQLPFAVLEIWWARHHGARTLGYLDVTLGNWLALGGEFVFLCFALAIVMGFAGPIGNLWWLPAAPCFVGLALLFAFITPYLLGGDRLADPDLRAATARLERIEHVGHVQVKVIKGIGEPNAVATGLGPSRRVFLWDAIAEPPFTHREVKIVIAHELGHLAHNHIWRQVGWYALFAFPGSFLIAAATRRRGGMREPKAVPVSLLALVALNLVAQPVQNVITRHTEAEADWSALRATHDAAGAIGLFKEFVPATLSQPDPPTWDYLMLETHPTIMQRLAMVQAWRGYATSDAQSP
ncbi:MAG: endopeptidase [Gaiellaceae bacterium]|nr:endopeptidase [Gaiellaceae bacterium]